MSGSFIGQLEAGTRRMQREYARLLDEVLGMEDFFQRHCGAAAKSKYPEHFAEAAEAELQATEIREYAPLLIPGLLQTPAYARSVCRAYQPTAPEEKIEEFVAARIERARLLSDPTESLLWAVIDESALRRVTGGRKVMAEALRHIADLGRSGRTIVQVLPFDAGAHAAMEGSMKLMDVHHPAALVRTRLTGKLPPPPAPRPPLRVLECANCGAPGRPESLPGGRCSACRGESASAQPPAPLPAPSVHDHAARIRAAMSLRRREKNPPAEDNGQHEPRPADRPRPCPPASR
ncbi:hypothetical protein SUDANB51_03674 [Streptomyces sp. enrichment culture]